jgi:GT2 family glycosyltransferase
LNTRHPNAMPRFAIAIVNYKTLDITKICLDLLKKHLDAGLLDKNMVEVWVVDNHSQDASTAYLRTLDWIHLLERQPEGPEEGFASHGKALDLILARITTDYCFLLHTDTFIYSSEVFNWMLKLCVGDNSIVAVGCLEQLNRGYIRTAWRVGSRFVKYHLRRAKLSLGIKTREPKPYLEEYIKSFCALWNVKWMKQQGLTFYMAGRIPTYELQDILKAKGYKINLVSPMRLFKYLDHVEAGTVGLVSGYSDANRRSKRKKSILKQFEAK